MPYWNHWLHPIPHKSVILLTIFHTSSAAYEGRRRLLLLFVPFPFIQKSDSLRVRLCESEELWDPTMVWSPLLPTSHYPYHHHALQGRSVSLINSLLVKITLSKLHHWYGRTAIFS